MCEVWGLQESYVLLQFLRGYSLAKQNSMESIVPVELKNRPFKRLTAFAFEQN